MGQQLTIEQWQQYKNAGWTDDTLRAHGYTCTTPIVPSPPPPPASSVRVDLSEGNFGVDEGRRPADGQHLVSFLAFDVGGPSKRDGVPRVIVSYKMLESTSANEIGGRYSKAYPVAKLANDFGKGRDALKGLIGLIVGHTKGVDPRTLSANEWNDEVDKVLNGSTVVTNIRAVLSTHTVKTEKGFSFTHHDWQIVGPSTVPGVSAPAAPMPAPGLPPTVPGSPMYMPGSPLGMPPAPPAPMPPPPQAVPTAPVPMPGWPTGVAWPGGGGQR